MSHKCKEKVFKGTLPDGSCAYCGWKPECEHENITQEWTNDGSRDRAVYICEDCDVTVPEPQSVDMN